MTLWVPSHAGIAANGAADAIAKAYVDEAPRTDVTRPRRASLVAYSIDLAPPPPPSTVHTYAGVWVQQPASRAVRGLFQRRLNQFIVHDLLFQPGADDGAPHAGGELLYC